MGLELFEHVPGLIIVPDGSGTRRAGAMDESAISASLLLAEAKVRVMVRASPNPNPNPNPSPNPNPNPIPNPSRACASSSAAHEVMPSGLHVGSTVGTRTALVRVRVREG